MKNLKMLIAFLLLAFSFAVLAEKKVWYHGCFEADGSTKKTTKTTVKPLEENKITKFTFAFEDGKSGSAYAQFPMFTDGDFTTFEIEIKGDGGKYFFEVWMEGDKGWILQKQIIMLSDDKWHKFPIKLVDLKSKQAKYLRILFKNNENPEKGTILLKFPKYL